MTVREGRDAIVGLVGGTIQLLGTDGWYPRPFVHAQGCRLDGNLKGARYVFDVWGPQGTDHIVDAKAVAEYWESLGMEVWIANLEKGNPVVFGSGGPVHNASFDTIGTNGLYSLGAVAHCSKGHDITLNDEDNAQRDDGIILPGDPGWIPQANGPITDELAPEPSAE